MKIALIIEHFDPTRGGAEYVAVWLAGELARRGHEVHVLCHDAKRRLQPMRAAHQGASHDAHRSTYSHGLIEAAAPEGVEIHKFRGLKLSTGLGFRLFGQMVRRWCRRNRPDIVHSLTVAWAGDLYHPEAGVYARMQQQAAQSRTSRAGANFKRLLQRLNGKQRALLTLEQHAVEPWAPVARYGGLSTAGPWKIISISAGMSREFQEHYALPPDRMVRLDNPQMKPLPSLDSTQAAQDRAWFRSHYALGGQDRVAAFVGHDFRRKGLRWAIEAISRTQTQWKLLVVGLGKVREYYELADRMKLLDRVIFVGPTREVDRLYHAADALLLPVFYDPAPLVVIEALASGLPVISTANLGSADIITTHQAGAIVEHPQDVAALAAALDTLPISGPERAALAARARQAAEGVPGDVFVEKLLALYDACAAAKRDAIMQG